MPDDSRPFDPPPPIEVAIAAIWRESGAGTIEVLVQQRPDDVPRGGVLELPGGKIERDETPIEAARREVREELSIAVGDGAIYGTERDFDPSQRAERHVRVTGVAFRWHGDEIDEARASARGARWMALHDFDAHDWPRANEALNRALRRSLPGS